MGQILHGCAKTTHAVRAAIQRSQATIKELSEQYDLNPKTVMKWKKWDFVKACARPRSDSKPRGTTAGGYSSLGSRRQHKPRRTKE